MARDNYRKIKLLKLLEYLQQNTDEQHPLTTKQLCAALEDMGIICDRRTLSVDIATLNELGYEIMDTTVGHEKGYYVDDRSFSIPELKILMDAVQASSFITEKKSRELMEKIAALGGTHQADLLKESIVVFNTRKHTNEQIFYNIDAIEQAIHQGKKIIFRYFRLDENKEKVYSRQGHRFVFDPVALILSEDNYYLLCYSSKYDQTSTYRVDRMESVQMIETDISEKVTQLRSDTAGYTEQVFKMYGGPTTDIVLEFQDNLLGAVYDKFGENVNIMRSGERTCIAAVKVQVSPVFWGWLFQFAGEMKIISPSELIEEQKKLAQSLLN